MVDPTEVITAQEPLSDEQIVCRVLAGETEMFEIVMRRHNQRLYRVARAILRNDGEAEDVCRTRTFALTNIWVSLPGGRSFLRG
jgi:hypothetical protein